MKNRQTFEVFRFCVHQIGNDLASVIAEWREDGQPFVWRFGEVLEDELGHDWDSTDPDSRLMAYASRMLFARVDWAQVAERLVAHEDSGPWPKHALNGYDCWCRQPVRLWRPAVAKPIVIRIAE